MSEVPFRNPGWAGNTGEFELTEEQVRGERSRHTDRPPAPNLTSPTAPVQAPGPASGPARHS